MPRTAARASRSPVVPSRPKATTERPPLPAAATLLTLDASSTAIGWAVFCGPHIRAADVISCPKSWGSARRIRHNAWEAAELIDRYGVTHVLAESQSHKSAGPRVQGLATLGKAQYYLLAVLEERYPDLVVEEVSEREWVRWGNRNMPKVERAKIVAAYCPAYAKAIRGDKAADKGLDACDAIGLALWRLGVIK